MDYDLYTDEQIVNGILKNDEPLITYFFQKKCAGLIKFIFFNVFDGRINLDELVNEFFLHIANNDWQVFRNFQYRSSLMTYISVVAVRFFQKKRTELIDSSKHITLKSIEWGHGSTSVDKLSYWMDIEAALKKMPNARYRKVIEMLDLQDVRPELLAEEMNVTVDNLYNIHRRALVQLRLVMGRKEDYV